MTPEPRHGHGQWRRSVSSACRSWSCSAGDRRSRSCSLAARSAATKGLGQLPGRLCDRGRRVPPGSPPPGATPPRTLASRRAAPAADSLQRRHSAPRSRAPTPAAACSRWHLRRRQRRSPPRFRQRLQPAHQSGQTRSDGRGIHERRGSDAQVAGLKEHDAPRAAAATASSALAVQPPHGLHHRGETPSAVALCSVLVAASGEAVGQQRDAARQ